MKRFILALVLVSGCILVADAQTCDAFVGGYIPAWRNPATVDYTKLSHVYYAFAGSNANGDLVVDSPGVFETFKTSSAGKEKFLSIGGGGDPTVPAMAASASARQAFVSNCVTFCQSNGLAGIDMDWEGIITAPDSVLFGALMRQLAAALHGQGLKLTATIAYGSYGGDFYNVGALKTADWIQLMVYDQTGTWADSPFGNHSSFQHVLDAVAYWNGRGYTDKSKIVIGLPFYGYRFTSSSGGLATGVTYAEIVGGHPDMSCDWDEIGLTVFNSPATIRQKVRYVIDNSFKGVMIWEMGQDLVSTHDKSLLKAISLAACDQPAACDTFITTGIESAGDAMQVVPNPFRNSFTVMMDQTLAAPARIELINMLGQRVAVREASFSNGSETVGTSELTAGIYFVRVTRGAGASIKRVAKID